MSRWRIFVFVGILLVTLPSLAGAQGFRWWQSDRFKTDLALTPDQSAKLEEVYQAMLPKLTSGKDTLDQLEKRLSSVIAPGTAQESDVMKLVDQTESARADLAKVRTLMIYRMHRVLTPEQRVKMNALHERWEQERRQGRRSPDPGPGRDPGIAP
jgi:Spy/CpxP family protein refolding chaperone